MKEVILPCGGEERVGESVVVDGGGIAGKQIMEGEGRRERC
jgi:hypothetical protein